MGRLQVVLVWVASIAICIYATLFLVDEFTRVDTMVRMGDIWSLLDFNTKPLLGVFTEIDSDDYMGAPLPQIGDTLVTVNGLPGTSDIYFRVFSPDTPAGLELPIQFKHGDSTFVTTVRTRSIPTILRVQFIMLFCLRAAITLGMLFAGLWAFARRPSSAQVRLLTLFCYSIVCLMVFAQQFIHVAYSRFTLPFPNVLTAVFGGLGILSGPLWMVLQMIFPHPRKAYVRWRVPILLVSFLLPLVLLALQLRGGDGMGTPLAAAMIAFYTAGYWLLGRTVKHAPTHLERRQARLVLWGSAPGIGLLGLMVLAGAVFPGWQAAVGLRLNLAIINILFLVLLLTPISLVYAFGRYRLLEIEARVRRGTVFVAVNAFLLAALGAFAYGIGWILMRVTGTSSTTPVVFASLGMAVGLAPAQRRIRLYLEDRYFPERQRLRLLLRDFLSSTRDVLDRSGFWLSLREKLSDGLHAATIEPVLFIGQGPDAEAMADDGPAPFRRTDELLRRLLEHGRPLLVDEIVCCGRLGLTPEQQDWLTRRGTALLLPLAAHGGLLGFVAAGRKQGGEDYTSADLEILASLSEQIGVAAENIELFRDRLKKEKFEQQLTIARGIQEGLLPRELPETPGLEIACRIIFCLDVAGDFYDVVPLGEGRTLIATGDVSGKGMGPALLMANTQASLRAMSSVSIPLGEEIAKLNDLLCDSTPEDFFITLFVMVFDPRTSLIRWVNAGHNHPLLLRADGTILRLEEGGLLLGVKRGAEYSEGVHRFDPGDSVLMYTDGVSEAMDAAEEEYGEQRIEELLRLSGSLGAVEAVERLENEVRSHHAGGKFEDDVTIVLCRRIPAAPASEGRVPR